MVASLDHQVWEGSSVGVRDRAHQNCSCPSCVGIIRAEYYVTSPYYNGEAWHRDIPKRKPIRRLSMITAAWQHVIDFEDWVYPIHTIAHEQEMIMLDFYHLRRWGETPPVTTQGRLTSIE